MRITKFEIVTCPECKKEYITIEGIDNQYHCDCGYNLVKSSRAKRRWFHVPDEQLIKFIKKFYKGMKEE